MTDRDENDLTTGELLQMWDEGEPVEIQTFKPTEESRQWLVEPTSASTSIATPTESIAAGPVRRDAHVTPLVPA